MRNTLQIAITGLLALIFVAGQAAAQPAGSAYPLFQDQTPLQLKITGPIRELTRDDPDERPERDTVVEYTGPDGEPVALDVEIRVRGKSRAEMCSFPPLRLDFSRQQVEGTVFAGQNQLKLVTLCKRDNTYRNYLAQEYMIYRLFNVLTERSFRVRWAEIEYVYAESRRQTSRIDPAFLIESEAEVAERLGLSVIEVENIDVASLDPEHTTLLMLFHYLIGNTDLSVLATAPGEDSCCHNSKVVGTEASPYFILPYDFDQAGFINTEYSSPSEVLMRYIDRVTQRRWRGFCVHNPLLPAAIAHANALRSELNSELDVDFASEQDFAFISGRARTNSQRFLERSFELINETQDFSEHVDDACR